MSRLSLGSFLIVGLLFWGLPATIVAGPRALEYTFVAVLPVWYFCRGDSSVPSVPPGRVSTATCAILALFSLIYLLWDAIFGRQLLNVNMFLFRDAAVARLVEDTSAGMGKGGGVADLLGNVLSLLPLGLIDATKCTTRYGRWILWAVALLLLFYETGSGRGFLLMVVAAIVLGRTSDWRRIALGIGLALAVFSVASAFRGDAAQAENPMISGTLAPFINLGLLLNAHCGNASWYSYILEFLKKFLPAFLIPKNIFSFNMEMSLCIYPSVDNSVNAISIFTWLGEIFYYTPSLLTALCAGVLMGGLAHAVDRLLVKNQLYSARLFAGLMCILFPRSRSQDLFTFLIAQILFLTLFWPQLCSLTRTLRRHLISPAPIGARTGLAKDAS